MYSPFDKYDETENRDRTQIPMLCSLDINIKWCTLAIVLEKSV